MNEKGSVVLGKNGGMPCVATLVYRGRRLSDSGSLKLPKRFIKMVDTPACIVMMHKAWGTTGYGAKETKVLHRWGIKSVLRRAGLR